MSESNKGGRSLYECCSCSQGMRVFSLEKRRFEQALRVGRPPSALSLATPGFPACHSRAAKVRWIGWKGEGVGVNASRLTSSQFFQEFLINARLDTGNKRCYDRLNQVY